ncbi:MAG TPA: Na+/H+ antiporter NhaC family protein, partial [Gemmatimonadales bacterium]|nr:Na+/H+ antiporter NhaC family protein [Gemmatimonadales bacterium]
PGPPLPAPAASHFPQPLALLVACVLVAALLSYLLPAGRFERREDPVTGRNVVVAGTYHRVPRSPVTPFQALVAIPRGMADAGAVIFYVFLVGGAFAVVERTGASTRLVHGLVRRLGGDASLVIPVTCIAFGLGGVLIQMQEELIAFVPMLLLLTRRLGLAPVIAAAVSIGAAAVGAAFSPVDPFQVVIAQKVAELRPQSAAGYRVAFLVPAMALWIWWTLRYARRTRTEPEEDAAATAGDGAGRSPRDVAILITVIAAFTLFIVGAQRWGWDFEQFGALFFLMGVLAGLIGRLGVGGTADAFIEGFGSLAYAALLIGFARAIYVVLNDGQIIDTIVQAAFTPLGRLPTALSAVGMMGVQALVHVPVPSTSGQAVLTMPVLVPLSDLLGLSRQVTVLAYQYGAGLCELVTPTNGALMAMLAATGVRYDGWMRFLLPPLLLLAGLGVASLLLAILVRLS